MITFIISILCCVRSILAEWVQSSRKTATKFDEIAVGFYQDVFYLMGGTLNTMDLVQYLRISNAFSLGSAVPTDVKGISQFYDQSGNTLYIINSRGRFAIYNMETNIFDNHWMDLHFPASVVIKSSCLVATDEHLFVIGGWIDGQSKSTNQVQTLNLLNMSWTLASMSVSRASLSCAMDTVTNRLYAIGGDTDGSIMLDSIEVTDIKNAQPQSWTVLDDTLTIMNCTGLCGCQGSRALTHERTNSIFIIGGNCGLINDKTQADTMHIINTVTNSVALSPDALLYGVATTGAIIVDNTMYCFGGLDQSLPSSPWIRNTWMEYVIDTKDPTAVPINNPSNNPSNNPTTITPTLYPTDPSIHPTSNPTNDPTNDPTFDSTFYPTRTLVSSINPTVTATTVGIHTTQNPPTDRVREDNVINTQMSPWIVAGVVISICVVLAMIVFCRRRMKRKHTTYIIQEVTSNSDGGSQMVRVPGNKSNHVSNLMPMKTEDIDTTELTKWLTNHVKLPQYVLNFADNGYETMQFVCDMSTAEDLSEIGITLKGHQTRILSEIKKFKAEQQDKEHMAVKKKQKQRHKPQRSILDEVEGENNVVATLIVEGSSPKLNNDFVIDAQGGVTLGSFPQDQIGTMK